MSDTYRCIAASRSESRIIATQGHAQGPRRQLEGESLWGVCRVRPYIGHLCVRFFFFSSRRRHTRCSRDWSSGRVLFRSQGVQPKAKAKPSKKPLHAVGGATELRRWTSRLSQRDSAGPKRPMMESEKK